MLSIDEEARKRFEADWLNGRSLSIKEYLPEKSKSEVEQTTYLGTLEELVCIDLEFRWRSGEAQDVSADQTVEVQQSHVPTRVEDYLREFPELEEEGILSRLIEQEIHVRKTAGYVVDAGEYKARFPQRQDRRVVVRRNARGWSTWRNR